MVIIDVGHGGSDPGAQYNGLIEKDLTLDVSLYQQDRYKELGIPYGITRTTDMTLDPSTRIDEVHELAKNNPGNEQIIMVSNHFNAGGGEGAEVIYALRSDGDFPNLVAKNVEAAGQPVREVYTRESTKNPGTDYYFMLRDTTPYESIIMEYGFLDNANDAARIRAHKYEYAEAVVKSVAEKLGYSYSAPNGTSGEEVLEYTVKSGDSLWNIAKKYNTTADAIKNYNNLSSNTIYVGQVLKIPQ